MVKAARRGVVRYHTPKDGRKERGLLKKRYCQCLAGMLLASVLLLAAGVGQALEASLPEPFVGFFEKKHYIRIAPKSGSKSLGHVEAGVRLYLKPVDEKYAETSYNGIEGYIFYEDATVDEARDVDMTPALMYAMQAESAYGEPHYSGQEVAVYPAHTPFTAIAQNGDFVRIQTVDGDRQYLPAGRLIALEADSPVDEYAAYMSTAGALMEEPLMGAKVLLVVPMSAKVRVTAQNGQYARITVEQSLPVEERIEQTGYVLLDQLTADVKKQEAAMLASVQKAAVAYAQPNEHAYTTQYLLAGSIVEVDETSGDFSHLRHMEVYVYTAALQRLEVEALPQPMQGYCGESQPLYGGAEGAPLEMEQALPPNTLVEVRWALGDSYCVLYDGVWGLVPKQSITLVDAQAYGDPL